MTPEKRAWLKSYAAKNRMYSMYYGWGGFKICRSYIVIYCCYDQKEAEEMMLELEMGWK